MLHAVFVRSVHARAGLRSLTLDAARARPGVRAVFAGGDVGGATIGPINPLLPPQGAADFPLLAVTETQFVGQPLAMVIADTLAHALAAAESIEVDYAEAPPVGDDASASPHVLSIAYQAGDMLDERDVALRVSVRHHQPRVAAVALETRATLAQWDGATLTAWLPTQAPARARDDIAHLLQLEKAWVRVIAPDVGGAFGAKASVYPEDLLVAWAAHRLGVPVKWVATRSEEFTSSSQGRGAHLSGTLALDAQGHFLHLEARLAFPLGAWLPYSAAMPIRNCARILPGPYRVAGIDIKGHARLSNAAPVSIYRGAGRPEAALLLERLVDAAARTAGIDPVELRRRNLIPADAMPYAAPTGEHLDSGDYALALERACTRFDYVAERAQQARRRARGELVGIGVAMYIEPCGQGWKSARVTLRADGNAEVASGTAGQGQGHANTYVAIAAQALGCEMASVTVIEGDTGACPDGIGALASRSIAIGGSAVKDAARAAQERRAAGEALPLTAECIYRAPGEAWSYGCVIVRLCIDAQTGTPVIERLVWVDDAGTIIAPQLAEGQLHGGLAQGIGQALMERIAYDAHGQLLTGSLADYCLPRARDMPPIELESLCVPATANALGAKGVGEAGTIGAPAAILNAAIDALAHLGVADLDFPLTAEHLWRTIKESPKGHTP